MVESDHKNVTWGKKFNQVENIYVYDMFAKHTNSEEFLLKNTKRLNC